MSTGSVSLADHLDSLAVRGRRWLWKTRLRNALRRHLPCTLLLLLAVPVLSLLAGGVSWLFGLSLHVPRLLVLGAWLLPPLAYLAWQVCRLWIHRPSQAQSLAVFDERFDLQDRLQTADEFLGHETPSAFMSAALEDARSAAEAAGEMPLRWQWGESWTEWRRLIFLPLLAIALLVATFFLPPSSSSATAVLPEESLPVKEEPAGVEHPMTAVDKTRSQHTVSDRPTSPREEEDPPMKIRRVSKGEPAPAKKSEDSSPQLTGREKISLGESEGGQRSQATSAGRSSQSRGNPGSQSPSSERKEKPAKPKKQKPKEPKEEKRSKQKRKELDEKSGATTGRGSSSGSSRNPASTDWSSKDRTEETDDEEFAEEEDVDDEDSESEARGGLQPSLRDRRPPVDRDLSIGFGNRANPDSNGRGGPGQRKKSRGVAALVLGVPVPDHVKGQPNPGRVKINQERIQPQPEDAPPADAEDRGNRSLPTGLVPERVLDAATRRVVRDYFLDARQGS